MKKRRDSQPKARSAAGNVARSGERSLTSYAVGALPILNRVIARADLEQHLKEFVHEDKRCSISPVTGTLILLRNYLVSRQPIYGDSGDCSSRERVLCPRYPRATERKDALP